VGERSESGEYTTSDITVTETQTDTDMIDISKRKDFQY